MLYYIYKILYGGIYMIYIGLVIGFVFGFCTHAFMSINKDEDK